MKKGYSKTICTLKKKKIPGVENPNTPV